MLNSRCCKRWRVLCRTEEQTLKVLFGRKKALCFKPMPNALALYLQRTSLCLAASLGSSDSGSHFTLLQGHEHRVIPWKGVPCIFFFCLLLLIFCPFFFTFQLLYRPRAPTVCLCVASTCSGHGTCSYYGIVMIPVLKTLSRKRKTFWVIGQSLKMIIII